MNRRARIGALLLSFDLALTVILTAVALSPMADAYAGRRWLIAAAGGLAIGLGATLVARLMSAGPLLTALLLVVGYLLVGPALALPDRAASGFLPTAGTERALLTGAIDAWRSALTLPVPLGTDHGVLIVPLIVALLGGAYVATFLWRTRWPAVGAWGFVAMFISAAAFGTRVTDLPMGRGAVLAIVVIVWFRWRAVRAVRTSWLRRIALTGAVVAVAGVAGVGLSTATAGGQHRQVLRDHVDPPLKTLDFKSPLSKYRFYYKNQKDDALFRVDGAPADAKIRLATMDDFDGVVWNVTTVDKVHGSSAFARAAAADSGRRVTITVEDYQGPWLPTVGQATGVTLTHDSTPSSARQLLFSSSTGAIAQLGDVHKGDVYRVSWIPRSNRSSLPSTAQADGSVRLPKPAKSLPQLDRLAQSWIGRAGATSDLETAEALENGFRNNGYFSDGLEDEGQQRSPSGHGAKRVADLVADPNRMIGNDEQYASAMALAAQHLGLPARVVLGFESSDGPTLTGDDIAAWVEIKFVGTSWVDFDPTPPETRVAPVVDRDPNPVPQPNVVQPPVLPTQPQDIDGVPPEGSGKDLKGQIWGIILAVLGVLWDVLKVILLLSPLWGLALAKTLRRRRRRTVEDPLLRISGGWREVTDRARDLGTRMPVSHTRFEHGVVLAEKFPHAELAPLATVADRHVFGPSAPTDEETAMYWADVESALKRMRRSVPWWRRPLAVLSPASIPWRQVGRGMQNGGRAFVRRLGETKAGMRVRGAAIALRRRVESRWRARKGQR